MIQWVGQVVLSRTIYYSEVIFLESQYPSLNSGWSGLALEASLGFEDVFPWMVIGFQLKVSSLRY